MKILVACEESQAVTKELRRLGHEAYSCDLLDQSGGHPEWHIKGDAVVEAYSGKYANLGIRGTYKYQMQSAKGRGGFWMVSEHIYKAGDTLTLKPN